MARTARARWPQRSTRHGRTDEERLPPYLSGGHRSSRSAGVPSLALRFVGALALLAMAAVHLQQFLGAHYSDIPTIGTLFALNFAGGTLIVVALVSEGTAALSLAAFLAARIRAIPTQRGR